MKIFLNALIVGLALTVLSSNIAIAATQTIKANVNGMVCAFCAQGIEKKMRKQPATKAVYVNLKKRVVAVELEDGETMSDDTVKQIVKDAGYDVVSIERIEQSVTAIKSELEAE